MSQPGNRWEGNRWVAFPREVRKPIIPRDTPSRRWWSKSYTECDELLDVLSAAISQGIPEEHIRDWAEAVCPASGWRPKEQGDRIHKTDGNRSERPVIRRYSSTYGEMFARLIREYGRVRGNH